MKNTSFDQFERKMQKFESNTRENDYTKRILQSELLIKKLQMQNGSLIQNIESAEDEINNLRDTLANIIPQNEQLKRDIMSMKHLIDKYQVESGSQVAEKQRIIEQLSTQIANFNHKNNHKEEMRKSDLSSMGELTKSLQQKSRLQQQIQQLKRQKLTQNQNYEKKLVKKDQIIKGMNDQSSQVQKGLKQIINTKMTIIKSMEEEMNYLKNELATSKHEMSYGKQDRQALLQQVQRLTKGITQMNQQLNSKRQASSQQLSQYKQQVLMLKKQLQQASRQSRQYQSQSQSLVNQNQQILKQYQTVKQQNVQQKQQLFTIKLQTQSLQQQNRQLTQQNRYLMQCLEQTRKQHTTIPDTTTSNVNMSRQIQLKQHYIDLLQQSRKQLTNNQVQLKSTFSQLQSKMSQLKMKQNQITQLKLSIANYQHYQTYFQNANKQLQQDKTNLLNKLMEKDGYVRSHENRVQELGREISKLRKRIEELERDNVQLEKEKQLLMKEQKPLEGKNSPIQHFYGCNNQKQLLHEQLRDTKKNLLQEKHKSQSYMSEVHKLKNQLETQLRTSHGQQTSPNKPIQDQQHKIHQLKEENKRLAEKLNQKTIKLQEKSRKLQKVQSQIRSQYQTRIKSLQKEIYKLTVQQRQTLPQQYTSPHQKLSSMVPELQKTDNLLIDDLDDQFELQMQKNSPQQMIQKQLNDYDKLNSGSKKLVSTDELPKSKQSLSSDSDRPFKVMYEELRVQNDSLQAHLERLSYSLTQTKENLTQKQNELRRLQQQKIPSQESQQHLKRIKQLQLQLSDTKEQLQRFQSLKQLLKLQKSQSNQKSTQIKQLQQKLSKLQKSHRQLKQDYSNLQSLNEQTNQKYKKTLEQFKKEMNHMNEQILKEKTNIDDKKKEMKRLQNEYLGRINLYEDQNMSLRSRVKKLELVNTKLQQKIKELQQEQIEKVIITRTQLVNYKQTQKRLQELQEQIHSLMKDKDKYMSEKKSLELYYNEEVSLFKNNFSVEREKILRKVTQLQEIKIQLSLKLEKTKEILQNKRKQTFDFQQVLQKTNKENYHIKLELSSALTQTNTQLIKNKALGENIENLQNQLDEFRMSYQGLVVEKSKNQRDKMTKNGVKVELEMAYKQIDKLNDLLMDKEKQINHFLTNYPTNDKYKHDQQYKHKDNYARGVYEENKQFTAQHDANRSRKGSREYSYGNENTFTQLQHTEPHYKSTKNLYPKQTDFVKEIPTQYINRSSYDPRPTTQNPEGHYQRKISQQQFSQPNEKYIGGFPLQYCTFAPQYHKI